MLMILLVTSILGGTVYKVNKDDRSPAAIYREGEKEEANRIWEEDLKVLTKSLKDKKSAKNELLVEGDGIDLE